MAKKVTKKKATKKTTTKKPRSTFTVHPPTSAVKLSLVGMLSLRNRYSSDGNNTLDLTWERKRGTYTDSPPNCVRARLGCQSCNFVQSEAEAKAVAAYILECFGLQITGYETDTRLVELQKLEVQAAKIIAGK